MPTWLPNMNNQKVMQKFTHDELLGFLEYDEPRPATKCKHCGQEGLQWVKYPVASQAYGTNFKWALVGVTAEGRLFRHTCESFKQNMEAKKWNP